MGWKTEWQIYQIQALTLPVNLVVIPPHGPRRTREYFVVLPSFDAAT